MFITVQRIQVICMFPFQLNFSSGAVHSADEKHLSADATVVVKAKYFVTNFCKIKNCASVCVQPLSFSCSGRVYQVSTFTLSGSVLACQEPN